MHLIEEGREARGALDPLARRAHEHTAGQHGERAHHLRIAADRRGFVFRPQQAAFLQGAEVGLHPGVAVGRQVDQGRIGGGVGQDRRAQTQGLLALALHKLRARHRRGRRHHIEAERHEEDLALVGNFLFGIGEDLAQFFRQGVEALVESTRLRQFRPGFVERPAEGFEIPVGESLEARIGGDAETCPNIATRIHIKCVAVGEHEAVGIDFRIETRPWHVFANAFGHTAQVGVEAEERQVVDLFVVADLGCAVLEVDVGGINVGEALQGDAVQTALTGRQHPRSAQTDRHIHRQRSLNEVAVGNDRLGPIGIDHLHVVQRPVDAAEVEGCPDRAGVDHLIASRFDLLEARSHQLHQRARLEAGAADRQGHPAAVTPLVGADAADLEGERFGHQVDRHVLPRRRSPHHQHVVVAGLGGGHDGLLIGRQRIFAGGVEGEAAGKAVVADVDLIG